MDTEKIKEVQEAGKLSFFMAAANVEFENDDLCDVMLDKIARDRLNIEGNSFIHFGWGKDRVRKKIHKHIYRITAKKYINIPLLHDFLSIVYIPYIMLRYRIRPDVYFTRHHPFLIPGIFSKIFFGSTLVLRFGVIPKTLAKTRRFTAIRLFYDVLLEKIAYRFVDIALAINNSTAEYLIERGIPTENIHILTTDTIGRDAKQIALVVKGVVREKYNIKDKRIILSVARLEAEKNHAGLIRSFARLSKEYVLLIVGSGSEESRLRQIAKDEDVSNRVIFVGHVGRDKIWNYFYDADVFVMYSLSEGMGNVLFEAMYAMLPVVGTHVDGIVDCIGQSEERGRFVRDYTDHAEFVDVMNSVFEDRHETSRRIANGYAYVQERLKDNDNINTILSSIKVRNS